ncbi:MAG: PDZ domain-containing protein, partial [Candidatus Binatia bacterium]
EKTIVAEIDELKDKEIPSETADLARGLGLQVERITPQIAERLGAPADTVGVAVTNVEPGSAAEDADLRPGDIIREVDRKAVDSPEAFENAVKSRAEAKPILLLIDRGGSTLFVTVDPASGGEGGAGESDAEEPESDGGFDDEPSDGESFGEMKRFPSL